MSYSLTGSKVVSLILALLLFSMPVILKAQLLEEQAKDQQSAEQTYAQGQLDGKRDAKGNPLWILAGCGCGLFGVLGAILIKPNPPAQKLIGKSNDYVLGYTEAYKKAASGKNTGYAFGGWAAYLIAYFASGGFGTMEQ
ncbi:MAG: hypothetical protein K9M99_02310 [Candidatus Cloacimonetes bacterium]|nr:hypothetical protein [Candidatus Cloacimonadota bacterium]